MNLGGSAPADTTWAVNPQMGEPRGNEYMVQIKSPIF
jgi:hypothetical protein